MAEARVRITAEDRTARAFNSANKRLTKLNRNFRAFNAIAAAAIGGGLVRAARSAARDLGTISDQADKLGLTTDALQELRFAAEQAGVGVKSFDVGFQRFTRRVADAAAGNKQLASTFKEFNIELTDNQGRLKSNEQVFLEFADAIKESDDQGKRILKTFQLFDTEGVDLVRLLQQGSGAIEEFRERARRMGAVIDESLIRKAEESTKELDALKRVIRAQLAPALADLAPTLVFLADKFATAAKAVADFFDAFRDPANLSGIDAYENKLKKVRGTLDTLRGRLESPLSKLFGQRDELRKQIEQLERDEQTLLRTIEILNKQGASTGPGGLPDDGDGDGDEAKKTFADITAEMRIQTREIDSQLHGWNQRFRIGQKILETEKELERILTLREKGQIEGIIRLNDQLNEKIREREELQRSQERQREQAARAQERAQEEELRRAREIGLTFSSAFEDAAINGSNLRDIIKGISDDILRIALRRTVTEPLTEFVSGAVSGFNIPFFANGTRSAPGGLAIVGERGPELVSLPRGSQVTPSNQMGNLGSTTIIQVPVNASVDITPQSAGQAGFDFARQIEEARGRNG